MVSTVYNEDVDKATELVFSMMHIDLVPCTLALLLHVLPKCLVGEGKEPILVHPGGKCLAKLTVDCLAASLNMRNSKPYTRTSSGWSRNVEVIEKSRVLHLNFIFEMFSFCWLFIQLNIMSNTPIENMKQRS